MDQLLDYLEKNRDYALDYFRENIPEIKVYPPDGTYLLWLDCSSLGLEKEELNRFFLDQARVRMNAGWRFADRCGSFMRLNIGCPRSMLTEGLERIRTAVSQRKY